MQSQQILKMSSSSPHAGTQASAPLVDGIVNHGVYTHTRLWRKCPPLPRLQDTTSRYVVTVHGHADYYHTSTSWLGFYWLLVGGVISKVSM